jgi:hypothetical protein
MKIKHPKMSLKTILIIVVMIFVLILNLFRLRFGFDVIILTMLVIAYVTKSSTSFVKDWILPVLLFFFYEAFRGSAFEISSTLWGAKPMVVGLVNLEKTVFFFLKDIPTVMLQHSLRPDINVVHWYDYVLVGSYTMFFWYWIIVGFIIWKKNRTIFKKYIYGLVGYAICDCFIYMFAPSAPPWYAANQGIIPAVTRIFWSTAYFKTNGMSFISTYGDNSFAAFPSHHASWPFFASLFLVKTFGKKALPFMIIPFIIAFATWYGGEHYVIDSLFGWIIAGTAFIFVNSKWLEKRVNKTKEYIKEKFKKSKVIVIED